MKKIHIMNNGIVIKRRLIKLTRLIKDDVANTQLQVERNFVSLLFTSFIFFWYIRNVETIINPHTSEGIGVQTSIIASGLTISEFCQLI